MAKQFKQIMGSVSRPDLLLLEYDQAIKDGYVRLRERKTGTRIIIDMERDVTDEITGAKVTEVFVDEAKEITTDVVTEVVTEVTTAVETPKTTARKTTTKAK